MPTVFTEDVVFQGDVTMTGGKPEILRSELRQEDNARLKLRMTDWRVWDAVATNLPATPANDDLGLVGGTFASASPSIQTGDLKNAGATTRYARIQVQIPHEYVAGETVTIRAKAGMLTTAASSAATVDFECYRSNDEAGIGSDLVTTGATTINSLTLANKDFTVTASSLGPGDTLDIRMAVAVNDSGTGTAVTGIVAAVELLLDQKG